MTDALLRWLDGRRPTVGLVLGSGLGPVADDLADAIRLPWAGTGVLPASAVEGHDGAFACGTLAGAEVLVQRGRLHLYEGLDPATVVRPVRLMAEAGVRVVLMLNAAGGVNPALAPGTLMLIADHLNLTGANPLEGPVRPGEVRFPDMSRAWSPRLRVLAREVAASEGMLLAEGVYAGLRGPSYETPAEIRMLRALGADAVGMSTVLEAIAAHAAGLECLGVSTITNPAPDGSAAPLSHADVVRGAEEAAGRLSLLVRGVVGRLASG